MLGYIHKMHLAHSCLPFKLFVPLWQPWNAKSSISNFVRSNFLSLLCCCCDRPLPVVTEEFLPLTPTFLAVWATVCKVSIRGMIVFLQPKMYDLGYFRLYFYPPKIFPTTGLISQRMRHTMKWGLLCSKPALFKQRHAKQPFRLSVCCYFQYSAIWGAWGKC